MNILTWITLFILFYSSYRGFPLCHKGNETQDADSKIKGYQYLLGWPAALFLTGINIISVALFFSWPPMDMALLTVKFAIIAGGLLLCAMGIFYFIKCLKIIDDLKQGKGSPL